MIRKIAVSGMIAALYAALTVALSPLSFGPVQFRVAEALTLLPFFMPEAIPGLLSAVSCQISQEGFGLIDIVVGSSATLAAAWLTYKTNSIWLAALPPVLINALAVGTYLGIITDTPVMYSILYIGISQAVICFCIGIPLCMLIASRTEIFDRRRSPEGGSKVGGSGEKEELNRPLKAVLIPKKTSTAPTAALSAAIRDPGENCR